MGKAAIRDGRKGGKAPEAEPPEEGYEAWLRAEIEAGCAELDEGRGVPAEKVWSELGLE